MLALNNTKKFRQKRKTLGRTTTTTNETKYNNAIIIIIIIIIGAGPGKSKVRLQIGAHKRTLSNKEVVKTLSIKIKTCFSIMIIINARAKFTKTENGYQTRTDT
jgi:hypothetical protein